MRQPRRSCRTSQACHSHVVPANRVGRALTLSTMLTLSTVLLLSAILIVSTMFIVSTTFITSIVLAGVPGASIVSRETVEVDAVGLNPARDFYIMAGRKSESAIWRNSMQNRRA